MKSVKQFFVNMRGYARLHFHMFLVPSNDLTMEYPYRVFTGMSTACSHVKPENYYSVLGLENL